MIASMSSRKPASVQRRLGRPGRQIGCGLTFGGKVAPFDAAAGADPFVGGFKDASNSGIGNDCGRADNARHPRQRHGMSCDAPFLDPDSASSIAPVHGCNPRRQTFGKARLASVNASLMAAAMPVASAEPWHFTTVPFSPRNTPPLTRRGSIVLGTAPQRGQREQRRNPGKRRGLESRRRSFADKPGGAFAGLQGDVACKPVGHHDIDFRGRECHRLRRNPTKSKLPPSAAARSFRGPISARRGPCVLRCPRSEARRAGGNAQAVARIGAPISAYCSRSCSSARTSAPTSSMTLKPPGLRLGQRQAMAGRFTPGSLRSRTIESAIRAPVLPQETATSASPLRTASIADHIEVPCRGA